MARLVALALAALIATTAAAGSGAARLFVTGPLAELDAGATLTFGQSRTVPREADLKPIEDGTLTIEIGEARTSTVSFDRPERRVTLPPQPVANAHPALLVFLESVRNSLAELSGGSPHYIKNRMVESFQGLAEIDEIEIPIGGEAAQGERLIFRPFENDPNAERMGEISALELRFVLSDSVPGGLHSLTAEAGGYRESFELEKVE